MNDHDLHDQLERLGRRPVPPPRPEFVETLLARIQLTDDLSVPSNVVPMRRQNWAKARFAVVGVAAAVLLGAVGMVALAQDSPEAGTSIGVTMAGNTTFDREAEVDGSGQLKAADGVTTFPDGDYTATCKEGGVIAYEGGTIACRTDEPVVVTIKDGRVFKAHNVPQLGVGEQQSPTTEVSISGLDLTWNPVAAGTELSWSATSSSTADTVARYHVLRSPDATGVIGTLDPNTTAVYKELPADADSFKDDFSTVAANTPKVTYRVVGFDSDGTLVADSGILTLNLGWVTTSSTR